MQMNTFQPALGKNIEELLKNIEKLVLPDMRVFTKCSTLVQAFSHLFR